MAAKPRLAIVGASVRAAAQSAVRAGFEVVGADLFADSDLDGVASITRVTDYPGGFADWLARQRVDAWMYTGALENHPRLIDQMASIAPLWGVHGDSLGHSRDPMALQRVLSDCDVAFPETRPIAEAPVGEPGWLGKTYRHSSGIGVWSLRTGADRRRDPTAYAQRIVAGRSLAAIYAVAGERTCLLGVTEQLLNNPPNGWSYAGSLGPLPIEATLREPLHRIGEALREPLGLRGLVGVDLVADEHHATVVEINPRYTASVEVLERAFGRSAVAAHRAACLGESFADWPSEPGRLVAKRVLFAAENVTISSEFATWAVGEQQAERLADRPRLGETIEAGQPVCTLLTEAADEPTVRRGIAEAVAEAERRLYVGPA